jgi:UDP-glucose 4-epimerase
MIIVLGASSFIGTYLTDTLIKMGEKVVVTGRNQLAKSYYESIGLQFIPLDISKKEDFYNLPTKEISGVILLAGLLPANVINNDPIEYIDVNVKGTLNALDFCVKNGIKHFITTTSYADVQLLWSKGYPIKADAIRKYKYTGDHAAYVFSKNIAADFVMNYNEEYGLQGSIFRLPPVYGVGPHSSLYVDGKLRKSGITVFIEKAIRGETIEIYGDSSVERDVVSVKDVVSAFVKAIRSDKAIGYYNICSGISTSLYQQALDIVDVFSKDGRRSEIVLSPQIPNDSTSYSFDISKAALDFGYSPNFVPFKKMMEDYKQDMQNPPFVHLISSST